MTGQRQAAPRGVIAAAALLALSTLASDARAQRGPARQAGVTALRADRMLDVVAGKMLEDALVVVENGRISRIESGAAPEAAHVVELGDVTLLPGFIDAHTHLGVELSAESFLGPVRWTEARLAIQAVRAAEATLRAGFTTVRDFGGDVTVELSRAVEEGGVSAPWIVPSRAALGITGGHCDVTGFAPGILEGGPERGVADGPWEVVKAVRYQVKHGARVIKTCATAGVLSMEGPVGAQQYSLDELEAMVQEAERHGIPVAAHAHGAAGILAAVQAGVASIEHGSELTDEIMELMIQRGTYLVPTTYLLDRIDLDILPPLVRAKAEEIIPVARASLGRAIKRGVPIAFGTDAGVFPHGENAREFSVYVELGMTELDALRAATLHAAKLLGLKDRGRLAQGYLADIVAVPGNPLEDISATERVSFVMRGGEIFKHSVDGVDRHRARRQHQSGASSMARGS